MCGRFTQMMSWTELVQRYRGTYVPAPEDLRLPSFNVAPTQRVPVVRGTGSEPDVLTMRWGLIPAYAKGNAGPYSTINARIETAPTSPAYRSAWKRGQRCIVPVSGFYEWHVLPNQKKQPVYIRARDQEILGLAGLWDSSTPPEGPAILSFTILTMPANALMARIHNAPGKQRMPAMLPAGAIDTWLSADTAAAAAVLAPYADELMEAWEVSPKVNSPKNNDPTLVVKQGEGTAF